MRIGSHEYANEADDIPKPAQSWHSVAETKIDLYAFCP